MTTTHLATTNLTTNRARWAAIGAAIAVTLGAGGLGVVNAVQSGGERGAYTAIEPCRLVDTRPGPGNVGDRTVPLGPDETYRLEGTGDNGECTGIPGDAIALALNVTPVGPTMPTNLRFFPDGDVPNASSLNPAPGQPPTPNAVTVDLANDGSFRVYNFQGHVHLVADIVGYFRDHNHDDRYYTKGQANNRYHTKQQVDTALAGKANTAEVYSRDEIDAPVSVTTSAWNARGSLLDLGGCPTTNNTFSLQFLLDVPPVGATIQRFDYQLVNTSGTHQYAMNLTRRTPDDFGTSTTNIASILETTSATGTFAGSIEIDPPEFVDKGDTFHVQFFPEKIGGGADGQGTVGVCSVELTYLPPTPD